MHKVTFIPGDGTGPDVAYAMKQCVEATGVRIEWEEVHAGVDVMEEKGTPLPDEVLQSVRRNKVAIKGPITTPVGKGFRSVNVSLRKALELYANLRPAQSIVGVPAPYSNVDLIVVRENTEGLYAGRERRQGDTAVAERVISRHASERIGRVACELAGRRRRHLTIVHKANILPETCGLFRDAVRTVAAGQPELDVEECLVDTMAMRLVSTPEAHDVIVTSNLFGDILSDVAAALVGGLGLAPAGNVGPQAAVFEPVHGSAPKYAGLDKANPTALILSAVLMLQHLGEPDAAHALFEAVRAVIGAGKRVTYDLGGTSGTRDMGDAIAEEVARLIG